MDSETEFARWRAGTMLNRTEKEEWGGKPPAIMAIRTDIAYRLAQQIVHLRRDDGILQHGLAKNVARTWECAVLKACEDAIAFQDRLLGEYERMLVEASNLRPVPPITHAVIHEGGQKTQIEMLRIMDEIDCPGGVRLSRDNVKKLLAEIDELQKPKPAPVVYSEGELP